MTNYIQSKQTNILDGLLSENIELLHQLNFISGENGTLKTKFLQSLKENPRVLSVTAAPCRVQAISPKRNAERKTFTTIFDTFRKQNMKRAALYGERQLSDDTFEPYPSLGDQFYVAYDDLCSDGGDQKEKMKEATEQFNGFIQKLFHNYELLSNWDDAAGRPNIELVKNGISSIPLEGLSLGEQEILALVANIYSSRELFDVFLIDEPEIHLNWDLEEKLFSFFNDFCEENDKQMVVVTHSRAVFLQKFLPKTQFFIWGGDGKVKCTKNLSKDQRTRIAGDAIEIMKLGTSSKTTFFVEDNMHEETITAIADALEVEISVSKCGNSQNVRSFFVYSKRDGGWDNTFFVQDGDNMGNPHSGDETFIHLDKYCMENYLIDSEIAATVTGKNEGISSPTARPT